MPFTLLKVDGDALGAVAENAASPGAQTVVQVFGQLVHVGRGAIECGRIAVAAPYRSHYTWLRQKSLGVDGATLILRLFRFVGGIVGMETRR